MVTPVWNKSDLTNRFLFQHWQLYRSRPNVEFVVIDNGSTDSTAAALQGWQGRMAKQLTVITNEDNRGFGPALNQGVAVAKGRFLILLSNDVIIEGDYISLIESTLENERDILGGAQVLDFDTGWNTFNTETIAYVAGWCVFCTREVWREIGGFDERYVPCDYEDLDLSLKAIKSGYPLKQVKLPLSHLFGQSAQHLEGGRLAITLKNQALFKEKWGFA